MASWVTSTDFALTNLLQKRRLIYSYFEQHVEKALEYRGSLS